MQNADKQKQMSSFPGWQANNRRDFCAPMHYPPPPPHASPALPQSLVNSTCVLFVKSYNDGYDTF